MCLDVAPDAIAEWVFPQKKFKHPEKGLPFLVGNVLKRIIRFPLGRDRLLDGVGGRAGVALHCLLLRDSDSPGRIARNRFLEPDFPLWIETGRTLASHPRGETFIQPEIVPPRHCDHITE